MPSYKTNLLFFILLVVFVWECKTQKKGNDFVENVSVVNPAPLAEFDSAGDIFFSHLGYQSVVLADGNVLLPDRELNLLLKISVDGQLLEKVLKPGRGPAEVQDINFISRGSSGEILVYDQINKKVVRLDENGNYLDEFSVPPWESANMAEIYELKRDRYLLVFKSFDYLMNPEKEPLLYLTIYDAAAESYIDSQALPDRPFARRIIDGAVRGGSLVPYAPEHLRTFNPATGTLTLFYSAGNQLARIGHKLDTLSVINVIVEPEAVSEEELAELREENRAEVWREMKPLIPGKKALAEKLLTGPEGNYWMKLNHRSEHKQWLVVNTNGEPVTLVNLPEDFMLTHIGKDHLGVRLDEVTYALFEPVVK